MPNNQPVQQSSVRLDHLDTELKEILEKAYLSENPIVQNALRQEAAFRDATGQELAALQTQVTQKQEGLELEVLQHQVQARITRDQAFIARMNEVLKPYKVGLEPQNKMWALHTHKMMEATTGARQVVDSLFERLVDDTLPSDYAIQSSSITFLGDQKTIYGNSKGTFLKTALLSTYMELINAPNFSNLPSFTHSNDETWIDNTALAHVVPLPQGLTLEDLGETVGQATYAFYDAKTPNGFTYIHSGYAFGGHRAEARYPQGKQFGPEDGSSWISKLIHASSQFSTYDQLYHYRFRLQEPGQFSQDWLQCPEAQALQPLEPVRVCDVQDVKPGDVLCYRRFLDSDPEMLSDGAGGHTTLVLGCRQNGQAVTLGYNRNMPQVEGFGIQEMAVLNPPPYTKAMLFRFNPARAHDCQILNAGVAPHIEDAAKPGL